MLSAYFNYPHGIISIHFDPGCTQIQKKGKRGQRIIFIDNESIESWLNRLEQGDLKFGSVSMLNDAWIQIDLDDLSKEENLVRTIQETLGKSYKPIARAKIKTHCIILEGDPTNMKDRTRSTLQSLQHPEIGGKEAIPNSEQKIEAIIGTIISRIAEFNSLYRSGPSLYFYKRINELRRRQVKIADFLSDNYSLEMLYATLVSWDMDSRGAKLKYFDAFRDSVKLCLPEFEAIENALKRSGQEASSDMLGLLKKTFLRMELMETAGRLVSNSKCLHFLFPSLCMPMDGTNTLQYLFGNTYESVDRYLHIVRFSFDVMRKPIQFDEYLDNNWNQSVPKLIDNAIIVLRGISIKNKSTKRKMINNKA